jgi:hypothetical protein
LSQCTGEDGFDEATVAVVITNQFSDLLKRIAVAGLGLGLLIRGGATLGKLYHAQCVAFGEALRKAAFFTTSSVPVPAWVAIWESWASCSGEKCTSIALNTRLSQSKCQGIEP